VIRLDYCTKECNSESLDKLRIAKSSDEKNVSAEKDYVIVILTMSKLDEE